MLCCCCLDTHGAVSLCIQSMKFLHVKQLGMEVSSGMFFKAQVCAYSALGRSLLLVRI